MLINAAAHEVSQYMSFEGGSSMVILTGRRYYNASQKELN
jgi:hypothetical protein